MKNTIEALKGYLHEVLGIKVKMQPWKERDKLPFFLAASYDFYETSLLKQPCLLIVAKEEVEVTPATLKKYLEQIQEKSSRVCIFVQKATTSYNRKRFIEHRIPFIIPGNQMYCPQLGIDLREYFRIIKTSKKSFSPATQVVVIYFLLDQKGEALTPSKLSGELGYTLMTMSRAFDELEVTGIGQISREGKKRLLHFNDSKREIWEKAKPLMRNPVKKRMMWVKGKKPKVQAGVSALAKESMLASPSTPVYAVSYDEWKRSEFNELPDREGAAFELEIWYYDPDLFAKKGTVDPFSLYLSLQGIEDERVEAALEEMMEKIKW